MGIIGKRQDSTRKVISNLRTNFIGGLSTDSNVSEKANEVVEINNFDITINGSLKPRAGIKLYDDMNLWIDLDEVIEYKREDTMFSYNPTNSGYSKTSLLKNISTTGRYMIPSNINNFDYLLVFFEKRGFVVTDFRNEEYHLNHKGKTAIIKSNEEAGDVIEIVGINGVINDVVGINYSNDMSSTKNYLSGGICEYVVYTKDEATYLISRIGQKINGVETFFKPSEPLKLSSEPMNKKDFYTVSNEEYYFLNMMGKIYANRVEQIGDDIINGFVDITDGNEVYSKPVTINEISVHGFNILSPTGDTDIDDIQGTVVNVDGILATGVEVDNKISPFRVNKDVYLEALMHYTNVTPLEKMRYKWSYNFYGQYDINNMNESLWQGNIFLNEEYHIDNKKIIFNPSEPGYYRMFLNMLTIGDVTKNVKVDTSKVTWSTPGTYDIIFSVVDGNGYAASVSSKVVIIEGATQAVTPIEDPFVDSDLLQIRADATFTISSEEIPNTQKLLEYYNVYANGLDSEENLKFKTNQWGMVGLEFTTEIIFQPDTYLMYNSIKNGKVMHKYKDYTVYVGKEETSFAGTLFFSLPNNPAYVPTSFMLEVAKEEIVDLVVFRENLYVFTKSTMYEIQGDVPLSIKNASTNKSSISEFKVKEVMSKVGLLNNKNITATSEEIIIETVDGIRQVYQTSGYIFNSKNISNKIHNILPDEYNGFLFLKDMTYMFAKETLYIYQKLQYNQSTGDGRFLLYDFEGENPIENDDRNFKDFRVCIDVFIRNSTKYFVFSDGKIEEEQPNNVGVDNGKFITCFCKTQMNYIGDRLIEKNFKSLLLTAKPVALDDNDNEMNGRIGIDVWGDGDKYINSTKVIPDENGDKHYITVPNYDIINMQYKVAEIVDETPISELGHRFTFMRNKIYEDDVEQDYVNNIPLIGMKKIRGIQVKVTIKEPMIIKDFSYSYKNNRVRGDKPRGRSK